MWLLCYDSDEWGEIETTFFIEIVNSVDVRAMRKLIVDIDENYMNNGNFCSTRMTIIQMKTQNKQ